MCWCFKGKWDCKGKCDQLHSLVKSPKQKYNKIVKLYRNASEYYGEIQEKREWWILDLTFLVFCLHTFNPCGRRSISNKIDCGQLQSQTKNVVITQHKRNFDIKVHNKYNWVGFLWKLNKNESRQKKKWTT